MADFKIALKKVLAAEGGYVDDPDDSGGETFAGVSRKNNKNWKGWEIIDDIKKTFNLPYAIKSFNNILFTNDKLMELVGEVYKTNYWDPIQLDLIPSQRIANEMFDTAVNMGVGIAIKLAYEVTGVKPVSTKMTDELFDELRKIKS